MMIAKNPERVGSVFGFNSFYRSSRKFSDESFDPKVIRNLGGGFFLPDFSMEVKPWTSFVSLRIEGVFFGDMIAFLVVLKFIE